MRSGVGMTSKEAERWSFRWVRRRLFRRQNRGLFIAVGISIFLTTGAPFKIWDAFVEQRCRQACSAYMRGEAGAQWVAPYANGAGYSALLSCTQDALLKQESYDCWTARVHACGKACVRGRREKER
mgnify:CR=1 FL=1